MPPGASGSSMIRMRLFAVFGMSPSWSGGLWFAPLQVNWAGIVPPEEKAELVTEICAEAERAAPQKQIETSERSRRNFIGAEVNPKTNSKPIKFRVRLDRKGRRGTEDRPERSSLCFSLGASRHLGQYRAELANVDRLDEV